MHLVTFNQKNHGLLFKQNCSLCISFSYPFRLTACLLLTPIPIFTLQINNLFVMKHIDAFGIFFLTIHEKTSLFTIKSPLRFFSFYLSYIVTPAFRLESPRNHPLTKHEFICTRERNLLGHRKIHSTVSFLDFSLARRSNNPLTISYSFSHIANVFGQPLNDEGLKR